MPLLSFNSLLDVPYGLFKGKILWESSAACRYGSSHMFRNLSVSTDRPILAAYLFFLDHVRCKVHLKVICRRFKWACAIKKLI